jgi:hypothetical protein
VSLETSLSRIFFWSKSKIPPQLGRAAFDVAQALRDEVDVLGFHGAFRKARIITRAPGAAPFCSRDIQFADIARQ